MGTLAVYVPNLNNCLVALGSFDNLPTQCVKCCQFGWDRDSLQPIQDTLWWSLSYIHIYRIPSIRGLLKGVTYVMIVACYHPLPLSMDAGL